MDRPETRFAWNGDVSLAYQVCGDGPTERFTPGHNPDVDSLTDDLLAVLKAARSERASILGTYEGHIPVD